MPVLSIEIPWSPDITTIGGFLLTWHGLFTAIGILAGVQLSLRMGRVVGYDPDRAYTLALVGVPSGIVGARLLFVVEHWDFYGDHLGEIIQLNEGGISIWGAVLGGVLGGTAFAIWKKYPIAGALDIAAFGTILGMAIGRLGDLVNGEHLARATDLPWGVIYTNPESPAFAHSLTVGAHHPATTYEMLGDLAILGLLFFVLFRVFRDRPGLTFFTFLVSVLGHALLRHLPASRLGRGARPAAAHATGGVAGRDPGVRARHLVLRDAPAAAVRCAARGAAARETGPGWSWPLAPPGRTASSCTGPKAVISARRRRAASGRCAASMTSTSSRSISIPTPTSRAATSSKSP